MSIKRCHIFHKITAVFVYIAYLSSQCLHGTAESFIRESSLFHNVEEKKESNQIEVCWFFYLKLIYNVAVLKIKPKFYRSSSEGKYVWNYQ